MKRFELTPSQSAIVEGVQTESQGSIWVVGGAVRDVLLGIKPKDIDFATNLGLGGIRIITDAVGLIPIPDQTAWDHGIVRVVDKHSGDIIDIATLRKDIECDGRHARVEFTQDLDEDLARRDLTINAMAAEIDSAGHINQIIDPWGGERDVKAKIINFVGGADNRVKEDWVRMLRACRFCALGDGWDRTRNTNTAIHTYGDRINEVSRERVRDELLKGLGYPNPGAFIRALDDCNLLRNIIPDLAGAVDVTQNEYHAEDVFEHLVGALEAMAHLSKDPLLRLAALLHDIGKPATRSVGEDDRVHFYRHEVEGASIAYKWMQEMRFSKDQTQYVTTLIRHHQWRFHADSKDKTIRRWLQQVGTDWRDLITLRMADRKGNLAKAHLPMMTSHMQSLVDRVEGILERGEPLFKEDLAINGNDLKDMGIRPGIIYKEIFSNMLGIVLADPTRNNKEWLWEYAKKNYAKRK